MVVSAANVGLSNWLLFDSKLLNIENINKPTIKAEGILLAEIHSKNLEKLLSFSLIGDSLDESSTVVGGTCSFHFSCSVFKYSAFSFSAFSLEGLDSSNLSSSISF